MDVFVDGDIHTLLDGAEEDFRRVYGPVWREDTLNWLLALMLKQGLISYVEDGEDVSELALKAIENTMKILGITWDDVEELFER